MSNRINGSSLWLIGWEGCRVPVVFCGTFFEAIAEANRMHIETGIQHAVKEVGGGED